MSTHPRTTASHPRIPVIRLGALVALLLVACAACAADATPEAGPAEPGELRETILPGGPEGGEDISPAEMFRALPRFGATLFAGSRPRAQDAEEQPAPRTTAPVPATYTLGAGDALSLQVHAGGWEQVVQDMTVTPEGFIFPDQLGRVSAAGRTVQDLRNALQVQYARIFATPTVTLAISSQRAIDVYVTGDVIAPGRYVQTGMVTVLDALYTAGGPSEIGSFRTIRLSGIGRPATEIDLYDYLLTGSREGDMLLDPGDTIFVPAAGPEVGVAGEVRRAARYELREETTVGQLLATAGGLTPQAHRTLHLWRTDEREQLRMISIDTTDPSPQGLARLIEDGDLLVARSIRDTVGNTVRILGAVKRPGYFPIEEAATIRDLVRAAEGLEVDAHVGRGVISRLDEQRHFEIIPFEVAAALAGDPEHNLRLQAKDYVTIYRQDEVEPPFVVEVNGAVLRPGSYRWAANLRVSQLLMRAGGLQPEAWLERADLLRLTENQTWTVVPVDLRAALAGDRDADRVLRRGDRLEVKTRAQVGRDASVHIAGFVQREGAYPLRDGMRVSDLIFAAGGLEPGAGPTLDLVRGHYEGATEPVRLLLTGEPGDYQVEPDLLLGEDDSIAVMGRGEYRRRADVVFLRGRVAQPGAYPIIGGSGDTYTVWDLLNDGGGLLDRANPGGIVVYRRRADTMGDAQQEDLSRVLQSVNREARQQQAVQVSETEQAEAIQQSVTNQLRQVLTTPSGVSIVLPPHPVQQEDWVAAIPIDGRQLIATEGREGNLEVEAGDTIVVPERTNTVMVLGAVPRSGAVPYVSDRPAEYYINESGGLREDSAQNRMIVVHANGAVEPIKPKTELQPGDVVVVPTRHIVRHVKTESDLQMWLRTIVPIATAALVF
ncbi:MAG: SLBB domain-containing protein [Armatimonadota bacterium]|jgi:protein involved in polysaccharide export with SLBB domain